PGPSRAVPPARRGRGPLRACRLRLRAWAGRALTMMTMVFPYQQIGPLPPIWALGGRTSQSFPLAPASVIGPRRAVPERGLLDPGASYTVFREQVAIDAGLDLSVAVVGSSRSVSGHVLALRFVEVELRITDGIEFHAWRARVGFTPLPMRRALLGIAGFLQFFDATFFGAREVAE